MSKQTIRTLISVLLHRTAHPLLPLVFLIIAFVAPLQAQPGGIPGEGPRSPGSTGAPTPYDTGAVRDAQLRTLESSGLLEQAIDPDRYMLGPNDQLSISIPTADFRQYDVIIYPDGKVVIPRVGEVSLLGKSLTTARAAIRDKVMQTYRVGDVSVSLKKMRQFKVFLNGAVTRPGTVVATPVSRVSEVIDLGGGASGIASKRAITILRGRSSIPVDLQNFYASGDLASNPYVEGGDVVRVGVGDPGNVVTIYGAVVRPGEFAYHSGDSVSSLIRYAWGLSADAFRDSIELVGVNIRGDSLTHRNISANADGSVGNDVALVPGDRIFVRHLPDYRRVSQVVVAGEVLYPGSYPIEPGRTRVRDLVQRAGGFTVDAAITDAALIRRQVMYERDQRLELIQSIDPEKRSEQEIDYLRNKSTERPGAMTIDFQALMNGQDRENIVLNDADSMYVPAKKDFIKVTGKVKNPGNVSFTTGASYEHYVELAGGYGWRADEGNAQIVKARSGDTFLASKESKYVLEPGDAILVPEEKPGDFWKGFTTAITVIAQIGTIVAVVVSIAASTRK